MRDELIELITKTGITEDEDGFPTTENEAKTEVFAKVKSVKASEFYQAYVAGMEMALIFCVDLDDYKLAFRVVDNKSVKPWAVDYDGVRYKIVRTYRNDMGEIELSAKEADHGHDL